MQRDLFQKVVNRLRWIIPGILFLIFYFYFFIFNRYHLLYLEQTQLFCFTRTYFDSFISRPGQCIFYLGEFFTQFFVYPAIGAGILTLLGLLVFVLSAWILQRFTTGAWVLALVPVMLIAALQSNHLYKVGLTIGFILSLGFGACYLLIRHPKRRLIIGAVALPLLYHLAGAFALWAALLAVLSELFYFNAKAKWLHSAILIVVCTAFPFLAWKFLYIMPWQDVWINPFPFRGVSRLPLFAALLTWLPFIVVVLSLYRQFRRLERLVIAWNYKTILASGVLLVGGGVWVKAKAYDPVVEVFLGMDHYVQTEDWNKVIELSKQYPQMNQLVVYYTNLAVYKTGQMANRMFDFPQMGVGGLQLQWARDEVTPFFGGEVFYHLNYINEAYRWAFESMVAKGLNPRSLKRLVLTSLINGHYPIAEKYLNILDQTMAYQKWASQYRAYVRDTSLISQDKELAEKRKFLLKKDFISTNLCLNQLLEEHPTNRMAFEYQMASFLLTKDLKSFSDNISRLKELGYRDIPVNYEEALLFCMTLFKKDLVPEGYAIRQQTLKRKDEYIAAISRCGGNRDLAARQLYRSFGNTSWYYLHFVN